MLLVSGLIAYFINMYLVVIVLLCAVNLILLNIAVLLIINNIQSAYDYLRGEKILAHIICTLPEHNVYLFRTQTCNLFDDGYTDIDNIWGMPRMSKKNRLAVCPVYYVSFMVNGVEYKDYCVVDNKQRFKFMNEQVEITYLYDLKTHKPIPQSPIGYERIIAAIFCIVMTYCIPIFVFINFM